MHNKKIKFNRTKVIGTITLIISITMAILGPAIGMMEKISPLIVVILVFCGCVGTGISAFVIVMPDTKNNEISKEILNHFDATHKN